MSVTAQLADGRTLQFPDGTDPTVVQNTVKKVLGQSSAPSPQSQVAAPAAPTQSYPPNSLMGRLKKSDLPMGGVKGVTGPFETLANAGDTAGKAVTDAATKLGASPPWAAGAGTAANVGLQAIPMVLGGGEARAAAPMMRSGAEKMMGWALKATPKMAAKGDAKIAIQEMLDKNVPISERGIDKLQTIKNDLNSKISNTIANSNKTVKISDIKNSFNETMKKYEGMPKSDLDLIRKEFNSFLSHPMAKGRTEIPIQDAQKLKQGFYRSVDKKYGQEGTGTDAAQKAIALALKEDIATKTPEVIKWNKEESRLLRTLPILQRRVILEGNRNILGLKGLRLRQPATFAAMMMDESGVFKGFIARLLNAGKEQIPVAAARTGIGAAEAINQERINQNNQNPPDGIQARANGGPVVPGQPYLVGENGPEVIVPKSAGTVVPNGDQSWLQLIGDRYKAGSNQALQQQLAPLEHQAYYREQTAQNPLMALPYAAMEPAYQAAKATGIMGALGQTDEQTTPASLQQIIASWKGTAQGLELYLKSLFAQQPQQPQRIAQQ